MKLIFYGIFFGLVPALIAIIIIFSTLALTPDNIIENSKTLVISLSAIIALLLPFIIKSIENWDENRKKRELYQKCFNSLVEILNFGNEFSSRITSETKIDILPSINILKIYKKEILDLGIVYNEQRTQIELQKSPFPDIPYVSYNSAGIYKIFIFIKPYIAIYIDIISFKIGSISIWTEENESSKQMSLEIIKETLRKIADNNNLDYEIGF